MDSGKQADEISALDSIYNKEEFSYTEENSSYQCTFKIFLSLPAGYYVTYKDSRKPKDPEQRVEVLYLPPLELHVDLPKDYPSVSPPKFTLCSSWLYRPSLAKLCKKLDSLWECNKNQVILFTWVAFLQDETLKFLNLEHHLKMNYAFTYYKKALDAAEVTQKRELDNTNTKEEYAAGCSNQNRRKRMKENWFIKKYHDDRAVSDLPVGKNPIEMLIDYNEKQTRIEFKKTSFTCKICFIDKLGEHCTQFMPCAHVFCKDCISKYLEMSIKEGKVQNICCPEEKCTSEATPGQIQDLISSELFAKYDLLLLNATLDTMTDIIYCPRRHCQYPVSQERNEQMATCPVCQYAFCIYCKMVYHGIEPCKINTEEKQKLVKSYQTASREGKLEMEQRYGKKTLQDLVENTMSENWIQNNSKNCPNCNTAIEKSDGCNKMTCYRCNVFFCWICCEILNRVTPYGHFQNPQSKCYNMLYHGLIEDENDPYFNYDINDDYDYEDSDDDYEDENVIQLMAQEMGWRADDETNFFV